MAMPNGEEKVRQRVRTVDVVNAKHNGHEVVPFQGVPGILGSQMAI